MEITDLVGLKEPMVKLLECVKEATGVLYEPTRIRRRAQAEADANIILARAELQKSELLQRAVSRVTVTEIRRQENIDLIVEEAMKELPSEVSSEKPDKDWMNYFFEACKDVSDAELQKVWGRILTEEISSPGKTSKRAISILNQIGKAEAKNFYKFCSLCWLSNSGDYFVPIDHDTDTLVNSCGLSFDDCKELNALGLIYIGPFLTVTLTNHTQISYFDIKLNVRLQGKLEKSSLQCYVLTNPGIELYKIIEPKPDYEMMNIIVSKLDKHEQGMLFRNI